MTAFDDKYMAKRRYIDWRAPIIADALLATLAPKTVLDLGCATGDIAAGLCALGVHAVGVDSSAHAMECLPANRRVPADLRQPAGGWAWPAGYLPGDLVILLEVLSIVEDADRAPILRNAMALTREALLVNRLRQPEALTLEARGFRLDRGATDRLRHLLEPWGHKQAIKALYRTGEIWRRRTPAPGDSRPESTERGAPPAGRKPSGSTGDPLFRLVHGENLGVKNPYDRCENPYLDRKG